MKRYHEKIYFPKIDESLLLAFTKNLNTKHWRISAHSLERVTGDLSLGSLEKLMLFIKPLALASEDIFEYYKNEEGIVKVCYRIEYSQYQDLVLVVGKDKELVTVYFNEVGDNHITLKKNLYIKEERQYGKIK